MDVPLRWSLAATLQKTTSPVSAFLLLTNFLQIPQILVQLLWTDAPPQKKCDLLLCHLLLNLLHRHYAFSAAIILLLFGSTAFAATLTAHAVKLTFNKYAAPALYQEGVFLAELLASFFWLPSFAGSLDAHSAGRLVLDHSRLALVIIATTTAFVVLQCFSRTWLSVPMKIISFLAYVVSAFALMGLDQIFLFLLEILLHWRMLTWWLAVLPLTFLFGLKKIIAKPVGSTRLDRMTHDKLRYVLGRKYFHLVVALIALPCCFNPPSAPFYAIAWLIALCLYTLIETLRLQAPTQLTFFRELLAYTDERDRKGLILTPFYLLLGTSLPLILETLTTTQLFFELPTSPYNFSAVRAAAGVLTSCLADSAAAIVGVMVLPYKRLPLPFTHSAKTIPGSVAFFVTVILGMSIANVIGYRWFDMDWLGCGEVIWAGVISTIVEGYTDDIDNVSISVVAYSLMNPQK